MEKSAKQIIKEALFNGLVEAITAMKRNSGHSPNVLLRDIASIHSNTTLNDLPDYVSKSIATSVEDTLNKLHKHGYAVTTTETPKSNKKYR